jgi:hypothetical protein
MTEKIDNEILDLPNASSSASQFFKIKSAKISSIATADDNILLAEPSTTTLSDPLYNNITVSKAGHVIEIDDTPGAERLCQGHSAGHFVETTNEGRVTKIFGQDFEIILDDKTLYVSGNLNITVNGNANMLIAGNVTQKIGGNHDTKVYGNMTTYVEGNYKLQVKGNSQLENTGTLTLKSTGIVKLWSNSRVYVDGSRVDINLPSSEPVSNKLTYGLKMSTSLVEPSAHDQHIIKTQNPTSLDLRDIETTYPKDRTK